MKISNRSQPVLEYLSRKSLDKLSTTLHFNHFTQNKVFIEKTWADHAAYFSKNVKSFSPAYLDAFDKNVDKLLPEVRPYFKELILKGDVYGTLLLSGKIAVCYYISKGFSAKNSQGKAIIFHFQDGGLGGYSFTDFNHNNPLDFDSPGFDHRFVSDFVIAFLTFLQSCPIETVTMPVQSKAKHDGIKYINETGIAVQSIGSEWFTQLHVTGAFKVRGHLRRQPKKRNGVWVKVWIWIADFQKEGYNRKPGKLVA